jgi:hypothetical protein
MDGLHRAPLDIARRELGLQRNAAVNQREARSLAGG